MSTFKEKLSNITNSLGFWFTGGTAKETPTWRLALLGLSIMTPIFLIMSAPWLAWISIAAENRYDVKYNWLQDFMIAWPIALFGVLFLSVVGYLIYNGVKQSQVNKENEKFQNK